MKVSRTLCGDDLTRVANDPSVRPWLLGDGPLDLSAAVADPRNIALSSKDGGWVLMSCGNGTYDVHSMFLPSVRGAEVAKALDEALQYVFIETDCAKLTTRVPDGNVAAMALARRAGFRLWYASRGSSYMVLDIRDWIQSSSACREAGEEFHHRLEAEKIKRGSALEVHDDDPAHDAAAGATFLMCQKGNAAKGVFLYNEWSSSAGYANIQLISLSPLVVDVVDAVLEGSDMRFILCR